MKNFFLSILTFLYLMLSTGFSLEVHYCMGSVASVDIISNEESSCAKCGMKEKRGGCCRDEVKFYKFENNFKSANFVFVPKLFSDALPLDFPVYNFDFKHTTNYSTPLVIDIPDPTGPPIYLRNRVFRI